MSRRGVASWVALSALAAVSCTLPDFEKTDSPSIDPTFDGPQCAIDLELGASCRACVARNCCEQAAACADGACGENIKQPITPLMSVTENFDALVTCMQDHCDTKDTCDISWGCAGKYKWPALKQEHEFNVRVFDFTDPRELGLPGVNVRLCESSDPNCSEASGLSEYKTDSQGNASFSATRGFNGYFVLEGGQPTPGVVLWSQPVYNVADSFSHQALLPSAVRAFALIVGLHSTAGEPFAPDTGHLIARIQSCLPLRYLDTLDPGGRAKDVEFSFAPSQGATRMYYVNNMAVVDQELDRTSNRGYAGAFEVPATNVTVTATHAITRKQLATGVIPIREGSIGYMYLMPDTSP